MRLLHLKTVLVAGEGGRLGSVSASTLGRVRAPVLLVPLSVWRAYRTSAASR